MSRFANFSGTEVVHILERHFGFYFVSQKGSHIKMRRVIQGKTISVIIPNHHELAPGTLPGIDLLFFLERARK